MPFSIRAFVYWTGVYNGTLALLLLFPPLYKALGLNICAPVWWHWMIAGFLSFTSAVLIISSRDLHHRASLVYWQSLMRYIAGFLLIPAGLFGDLGLIVVPVGLGDLVIGLIYMRGLSKELDLSHYALLCDRSE